MFNRFKTERRFQVILFMAFAILLAVGTALAQGPDNGDEAMGAAGMGRGFGPGQRLERLAERLELTEEQITAIKGIHEAGQKKNLQLRKEMMRLKNELKGEMLKDDPSDKTTLDLVTRIGALRTEMQAGRLQTRLDTRRQLTPEQRDKMLMLQGKHSEGRDRRGCGRGDDDGPRSGRRHGAGRENL